MFKQLPLGISLPENVTFANFVAGENLALLDTLQKFCVGEGNEQHLYLWGQNSVGRSHLLQAACHQAAENNWVTAYIPLIQAHEFDSTLLQDLQHLQLICIDDVQAIAGNKEWEQALFYLYQRALDTKTRVIWSANAPPARLTLQLADLRSRLAASLVLQIQPLNDADKLHALQQHAAERGLTLPDSVGQYLLAHCSRQMKDLFTILDKLDREALIAQRALTIPFIKQVLNL
jgi:DnaA family protein